MDNTTKKHKPMFSMLQKRQKRLHSGAEGTLELLPKLKGNLTKKDIVNRLKDLVGLSCATNADKFHLLRRRDVFLYKLRDIDASAGDRQITKGTCPDMCPEKERYMRDAKKALHFYECNAQGQMVHEKMVKDYSRSAADQDTPLPHELRSLSTLQFTMDYLIFYIANEMPSTNADLARWYDFLWSRTRAIRKDITQQMLNNELAVDLVEKCVRLHIFASFRLVHLEADLFDHKMNTENLSKSLQTLRHMYDDLAKKQVFCSNEPEFRSYDIILNLSDFNVHSQVLSYRVVVREDRRVQLSLNLASALQNNNYIRFFRLVRHQASFLQACLCHHFFPLIRSTALKVLCMAYNIFPLDAFVEYLAFDSSDEAVKFLQQFFLELDVTDANLINVREGRNVFMPGGEAPNVSSIQQTTCRWIELKAQNQPLSKILCNNPMAICPEILNILPKPVDSFSRDNLYMNDPVLNELFTDVILDTRKSLRVEEQDVKLNEPPTFSFTRALQSAVGIQIGTGQKRSSLSELMLSLQEGIVDRVVQTEIINIILKIMRENNLIKRAIGHWKTFTKNKRLRKSAIKLSETLFDNIIDTQLQVHATRAFRIYQTEYNIQLANIIATAQMDSILDKLIPELLCKIARRTRANQVRDIEQRLEHIRENLHLKWLRQFTNHWLSVTRRNRILRNITFIAPGNIRSSLTLSPSRRLFRPGIKNLTPERMQEMAEERMRRIEEERKRRQEEEEQNNLRENGTSSNTGGRHLRPAMAIREQVLDGVSFENVDRPFYFASANLNLFCPVRQQISPELLQKMAERKLRQNDYLRQHQRDSRTTTENGIHARTDEEGYFDDQRQQHTGPSSSKRARLNYF